MGALQATPGSHDYEVELEFDRLLERYARAREQAETQAEQDFEEELKKGDPSSGYTLLIRHKPGRHVRNRDRSRQ